MARARCSDVIRRAAIAGEARGGFILVATLWIIAALAALASIALAYVSQSAVALTANDEPMQREALIRSGLELTAYQLSAYTDGKRPARGAFRFRLAQTSVAVSFVSEAARVNINTAPKVLIAGLLGALGAPSDAAEQYATRVIAWRTTPKANAENREDSLYRVARLNYSPRGAPFNHVGELWLVLGLPPALVERALPFVTIYSGMRDINVLVAAPEVIAALPGMTPMRLNAFLNQRDSLPPDPQVIESALGGKQRGATTEVGNSYRVTMNMTFPDGRRSVAEVVAAFAGEITDVRPYNVLAWQDDFTMNENWASRR